MFQITRTRTRAFGSLCGVSFIHALLLAVMPAVIACGPATEPPPIPLTASSEWREFEGSWNAAGSRRSLPLGGDRRGSIIELRGSMLLAGTGRPGAGFHSELIGLADSATGLVGRSVWTDERGDQVFSVLEGEGTAAKNHISGNIVGGTGRFRGAEGSYEFSWHWVIEAEDGSIQGRANGLKGRVRIATEAAGQPR
jgi:hypothetical protein